MKTDIVTTEIVVKKNKIGIMRFGNVNYISFLTDLARYKDKEITDYIIQNWMRTKKIQEYINNPNFKSIKFNGFKNESGTNVFVIITREQRDSNHELSEKGNIRDYTDLLHLVILNNL